VKRNMFGFLYLPSNGSTIGHSALSPAGKQQKCSPMYTATSFASELNITWEAIRNRWRT